MALRIATPPIGAEKILAAASGATYGKIGTVLAAATLYVRCPTEAAPGPGTSAVDWRIQCNKAHTVTFYKARTNVLGGTITLTDATGVDDGDTFVLNGLTFTAESTESDALASGRKYYIPSQVLAATNLSALLSNATYGVPGIGTITQTVPTTTDVLTIAGGSMTALQFGQGTSDANEIAWAETTLASLIKDGSAISGIADNSTTSGTLYQQWADGWPQVYVGITNNDSSNAATVVVGATIYQSV